MNGSLLNKKNILLMLLILASFRTSNASDDSIFPKAFSRSDFVDKTGEMSIYLVCNKMLPNKLEYEYRNGMVSERQKIVYSHLLKFLARLGKKHSFFPTNPTTEFTAALVPEFLASSLNRDEDTFNSKVPQHVVSTFTRNIIEYGIKKSENSAVATALLIFSLTIQCLDPVVYKDLFIGDFKQAWDDIVNKSDISRGISFGGLTLIKGKLYAQLNTINDELLRSGLTPFGQKSFEGCADYFLYDVAQPFAQKQIRKILPSKATIENVLQKNSRIEVHNEENNEIGQTN